VFIRELYEGTCRSAIGVFKIHTMYGTPDRVCSSLISDPPSTTHNAPQSPSSYNLSPLPMIAYTEGCYKMDRVYPSLAAAVTCRLYDQDAIGRKKRTRDKGFITIHKVGLVSAKRVGWLLLHFMVGKIQHTLFFAFKITYLSFCIEF